MKARRISLIQKAHSLQQQATKHAAEWATEIFPSLARSFSNGQESQLLHTVAERQAVETIYNSACSCDTLFLFA